MKVIINKKGTNETNFKYLKVHCPKDKLVMVIMSNLNLNDSIELLDPFFDFGFKISKAISKDFTSHKTKEIITYNI